MHWSSSPENRRGFTMEERDRRWKGVREQMSKQGVDVLLALPQWLTEDAMYLSNQVGVVIFPVDSDPALIIGGEGSNRAVSAEGWIQDRSSATERGSTRVAYGEAAARKLKDLGLDKKRIAIAGLRGSNITLVRQPEGYANYTTVNAIREALPDAQIVDGTPVIAPVRHAKSEAELAIMRDAVRIAEASADALFEHARPGVPQAEAFGQMLLEQMRCRADNAEASWCGGHWGEHKWRYTTPPPGLIEPRWYILTEIGPTLQGYNCQISEPFVVGPPDQQAREVFELGHAAFDRTVELMKAGNTWGDVKSGVQKLASKDYEIELLVHGRGLGAEGPMLIPVDTHQHAMNMELVAGSTFVVKPYAFPTGGYAHVTRSHDTTWGDTVVVRDSGAERLGTRPHQLRVIDG
ncbi:MAG: aminopeptidase P family protein [Chloroflexi bacterium]|nr:aminopeptidase P family protein [Chloroflexota bacterium]